MTTTNRSKTAEATRALLAGSEAPAPADTPAAASARTVAGIPRGGQRQLTVYLEPDLADRLAAVAAAEERSVAFVVRRILRERLGP